METVKKEYALYTLVCFVCIATAFVVAIVPREINVSTDDLLLLQSRGINVSYEPSEVNCTLINCVFYLGSAQLNFQPYTYEYQRDSDGRGRVRVRHDFQTEEEFLAARDRIIVNHIHSLAENIRREESVINNRSVRAPNTPVIVRGR